MHAPPAPSPTSRSAFFSLLVSAAAMLTIQTAMCIYDIVTYAAYRADFDRRGA